MNVSQFGLVYQSGVLATSPAAAGIPPVSHWGGRTVLPGDLATADPISMVITDAADSVIVPAPDDTTIVTDHAEFQDTGRYLLDGAGAGSGWVKFDPVDAPAATAPPGVAVTDATKGSFTVPSGGLLLTELKIVHRHGGLTCRASPVRSNFGCADGGNPESFYLFVTDAGGNVVVPATDDPAVTFDAPIAVDTPPVSYTVAGTRGATDSTELRLRAPGGATFLPAGDYTVWYGEELFSVRNSDNAGTAHYDVLAWVVTGGGGAAPEIRLKAPGNRLVLEEGAEYRIWHGEDLVGYSDASSNGTVCYQLWLEAEEVWFTTAYRTGWQVVADRICVDARYASRDLAEASAGYFELLSGVIKVKAMSLVWRDGGIGCGANGPRHPSRRGWTWGCRPANQRRHINVVIVAENSDSTSQVVVPPRCPDPADGPCPYSYGDDAGLLYAPVLAPHTQVLPASSDPAWTRDRRGAAWYDVAGASGESTEQLYPFLREEPATGLLYDDPTLGVVPLYDSSSQATVADIGSIEDWRTQGRLTAGPGGRVLDATDSLARISVPHGAPGRFVSGGAYRAWLGEELLRAGPNDNWGSVLVDVYGYVPTEDRACQACGPPCEPGTFEAAACGTPSPESPYGSDRSCVPCRSRCEAGFYISGECTAKEDRKCLECDECAEGFYKAGGCDRSINTICEPCLTEVDCAKSPGTFLQGVCGAEEGPTCAECSPECTAGTVETRECTATHDRECTACIAVCPAGQTLTGECSGEVAVACAPCRTCGLDEVTVGPCTPTVDTVCAPCPTSCPSGETLIGACGGDVFPECAPCANNECPRGFRITGLCDATTDTQECERCITAEECAPGLEYLEGECDGSGREPTRCVACSAATCPLGKFRTGECGADTAYDCADCSPCLPGQRRAGGCSGAVDTQCAACTTSCSVPDTFRAGRCEPDGSVRPRIRQTPIVPRSSLAPRTTLCALRAATPCARREPTALGFAANLRSVCARGSPCVPALTALRRRRRVPSMRTRASRAQTSALKTTTSPARVAGLKTPRAPPATTACAPGARSAPGSAMQARAATRVPRVPRGATRAFMRWLRAAAQRTCSVRNAPRSRATRAPSARACVGGPPMPSPASPAPAVPRAPLRTDRAAAATMATTPCAFRVPTRAPSGSTSRAMQGPTGAGPAWRAPPSAPTVST